MLRKYFKKGAEKTEEAEMKSYGECDGKRGEGKKREGGELQETLPYGLRLRSWGMKVMSSFKAASSVVCTVLGVCY